MPPSAPDALRAERTSRRALVISSSYPQHAGDYSGHFVESEAVALAADGWAVTVLAPQAQRCDRGLNPRLLGYPGGASFGPPGLLENIRRNPACCLRAAGFVAKTLSTVRSTAGVDLIVAHWLLPWTALLREAYSTRIELVAHGSDVALLATLPVLVRHRLGQRVLRNHFTLRFVSADLLSQFEQLCAVDLKDAARIQPSPIQLGNVPEHRIARSELGLAPTSQIALVVGRLIASKRIDVALRALEKIDSLRPIVIGGGPELGPLRQQFPGTSFLGELDRPTTLTWISAADVLVSSSLLEGSPTAIREARALGTPVVSLPCGDIPAWAASDYGLWLAHSSKGRLNPR